MRKNTYFITGGGTGGHIYPAIAVADELLKEDDTEKIYYVGNPNNLEASIVANKNYEFLPVISSGMPRKIGFSLFVWSLKMFSAWIKCCIYILKYKPDVIFGTGGYVSAPTLLAGLTMKVPFVMHDCDANPGLVTRKLAPYAKCLSVAFEIAKEKIKNQNCEINGNPIRQEFAILSKNDARNEMKLENKLTICIMGGSQGAKSINNATVNILQTLSKDYNAQVIFQTGKKNYDNVINNLKEIYPEFENDKNLIIRPYFDNMAVVLKSSDIAISRAGSLSISELCASSTAAIFIPYPFAAADHQRKNAQFMVEQNAGLYLEDENTNSETLLKSLKELLNNPNRLSQIQTNAAKLAKLDGAKNIIAQIKSCIKQ